MKRYVQHGIIAAGLVAFGFLFWLTVAPPARPESYSVEDLRRLLREGATPEDRALGAAGLGERGDVESMPQLLDALDADSPLVRGSAGVAVQKILGANYDFNPDAPAAQRAAVVERYRQLWAAWQLKQNDQNE